MRDADVRRILMERFDSMYAADPDTRVVEELGICHASVRADVAVINGSLKGYEIKSDRDTLVRLAGQVEAYCRIFDTVSVVVAERHLARTEETVPEWWGIEVATTDAESRTHLSTIRAECHNSGVDPFSLVQLLWRDEALSLLDKIPETGRFSDKPRRFAWEALAGAAPVCELKKLVRECLKSRKQWRAGQGRMLGDAKFQLSAKSSDCLSALTRSRNRRYTHRPN